MKPLENQTNVFGDPLQSCSMDSITGFFRTGCCDMVSQTENAENWIELKRVRERSEVAGLFWVHYASFWPATSINFVSGFVKFLDADPLS